MTKNSRHAFSLIFEQVLDNLTGHTFFIYFMLHFMCFSKFWYFISHKILITAIKYLEMSYEQSAKVLKGCKSTVKYF